jgi:hypothetical protein
MMHLVYNSQNEARQALTEIWLLMQPVVEVNAKTLEAVNPQITKCWAVEQQRSDGKWIFPAPPFEFIGIKEDLDPPYL